MTWTAATDNATAGSAIEYEIRVSGTIVDAIPGGTQTISYSEIPGTNSVTVVAVDRFGNASAPSNAIPV